MIKDDDAALLRKTAELPEQLKESLVKRDDFIRFVLNRGATVVEVVELTGLTRARIYQIKDAANR